MQEPMTSKELMKMYRNGTLIPEHYGDYWEENDRQRLKEMFLEGEDISKIALRLERNESSVFQQLVSMDLFSDSRTPRARRKAFSGCKCKTCIIPDSERPPHCIYRRDNNEGAKYAGDI